MTIYIFTGGFSLGGGGSCPAKCLKQGGGKKYQIITGFIFFQPPNTPAPPLWIRQWGRYCITLLAAVFAKKFIL